MQPIFKTINEMKIIGVAGRFISVVSPDKNNMVVIPKLWQTYMPRKHEIKNAISTINLGVCFEIPIEKRSRLDECLYVAATEVSSFDQIPEGMESFVIPAGEYAVFTHKGPIDTYEKTVNYIYKTWFPTSGKRPRCAPDFELYDQRFNLTSSESEIDIYIPVE